MVAASYLPMGKERIQQVTEGIKADVFIEKGIPIPKINNPFKVIYPWEEMEIGDSFFTEKKISSHVTCANKRMKPKRFTSRKVEGGYRVWRVEDV